MPTAAGRGILTTGLRESPENIKTEARKVRGRITGKTAIRKPKDRFPKTVRQVRGHCGMRTERSIKKVPMKTGRKKGIGQYGGITAPKVNPDHSETENGTGRGPIGIPMENLTGLKSGTAATLYADNCFNKRLKREVFLPFFII